MTKTNMSLAELLEKHGEGDFLRTVAEAVLQLLMEADVDGVIGAGRYEYPARLRRRRQHDSIGFDRVRRPRQWSGT